MTNDRGFVPQDEQFENGGTMREADKTSYWIVEPKSFAYNPARINVGSIGYQSTSRNVIVSSLYEVFQADETCDNRFLWHWFKTRLFTQQIEMLQEGGVRLYFFFDKLLKSGISMPSVDEQRLIGEQFDRIDYLITLHQCKCQYRSLYGYLSWEQRKFGELYRPVSEKNDLSFGRDRAISVANMYFNPAVYVTEDSYLATYNVMRLGDIAFEGNRSKRFAHGRFVENTIGDGIVSHVFKVFRHIGDNYDLSYWKYAINNEKLMRDVLTRSTKASTMMHELVTADFLEESTLVPSLNEQRAIGAAIDSIDRLITLHQR